MQKITSMQVFSFSYLNYTSNQNKCKTLLWITLNPSLGVFYSPQSITFTTGTSWVYDAADTIYIVSGQVASDFIQVYALNIPTLVLSGAGQLTATQGVVHLGCMAMFSTNPTGEKVLFVAICTSRLLYKGINLV